jgi:hypothetical protein
MSLFPNLNSYELLPRNESCSDEAVWVWVSKIQTQVNLLARR